MSYLMNLEILSYIPSVDGSDLRVNFALDPGVKMENIVITADIRKRPKLTTRVVYADGTPAANSLYMSLGKHGLYIGRAKVKAG